MITADIRDTLAAEIAECDKDIAELEIILARRKAQRARLAALCPDAPHCPTLPKLTPSESLTLSLLVLGKTDKEIASECGLTPGSAKQYVRRVCGRLGVSTRTEAATFALRHGLA